MSELVMRDRKASRLAAAWIATDCGDAAVLSAFVDAAMVEQVGATTDPDIVTARAVLANIERLASGMSGHHVRPASATTWWLVVRKLQAQERVMSADELFGRL